MKDRSKHSKEILEKLSRRKLLRDSAITAAGAVLLPSLITGCDKADEGNNGLGGPDTGWIGGFAQSDPAFAYPDPDLSSLPLLDNMDNIDLLQRQQAALWPQFSWETEPGNADPKRCFQMFAPDISRVGYTDTGRIYSIICPQQGVCFTNYGCMNVEVSVTGQRGWVDEDTKLLAADMTVEGKIWFSPSGLLNETVQLMWDAFKDNNLPFPADKGNSIKIGTYLPGNPDQPVFPLRSGQTARFISPDFAIHKEAWAVANIDVEIGPIKTTNIGLVDDFNQLILDFFNLASGNMLQLRNVLSWNVWLDSPAIVVQKEWYTHAERWRQSIDEEHEHGPGTIATYFDGTPFNPVEELVEEKIEELLKWIADHL
jgi:hypothetical protein